MKLSLMERLRALRQEPFSAVKQMGISAGQTVADLGAGLGYFTVPSAIAVGPTGRVYSVEPDRPRSDKVRARVARERLDNVIVLTTDAEHLSDIPSNCVNLAFSAFTLHHFTDKQAAMSEVRRILVDGGAFYVWDRIPGRIVRHGTLPEELNLLSKGFTRFDTISSEKTLRARFSK